MTGTTNARNGDNLLSSYRVNTKIGRDTGIFKVKTHYVVLVKEPYEI